MNGMVNNDRETEILNAYNSPLACEEWREVLHLGIRLNLRKGTILPTGRGQKGTLYYLEKGLVLMMLTLTDGREKILFCVHPGSLMGETPLFDALPPLGNIVTGSDCIVYAFSQKIVMEQILPQHPHITYSLLKSMANKFRMLSNQIMETSFSNLSARVCRFFYTRAASDEDFFIKKYVQPLLTQQELAALLGVHRVTLSKVLHVLTEEGIIGKYSKNRLQILDIQRLKHIAHSLEY